MNEEELYSLQEATRWVAEGVSEDLPETAAYDYLKSLLMNTRFGDTTTWLLREAALDPLVPDIKQFFGNIFSWVTSKWTQLWAWLHEISEYLESFWNAITAGLDYVRQKLVEGLEGIVNLIWNSFTLIWSQFISEIGRLVDEIVAPIRALIHFFTVTLVDWYNWIRAEIARLLEDPAQWLLDLGAKVWESVVHLGAEIWDVMVTVGSTVASWIGERITGLSPSITEYLRDVLFWLWEVIKTSYVFVKDEIAPAVWEATTGAVGWLKDQFTHTIGLAYDELMDLAKSFTPITPGKSVALAGIMFGSAVGFGALSHGMALAVEAIPNLKYMGVHYLSAFAARMGGFGAISTATVGVIAALALRVPFSYYMNNLLRPTIPDDKLLIEFRAKRELNFSEFKRYMGYHGHSDQWTQKIDSWLWKDPRLFEILYCADVTVPPREWLVRKFERAGYEAIDVDVLCRVVDRRTTRSPRTYFTSGLRRNYRHGFMTERELVQGIEDLELAKEGVTWIKRAGELDVIYEIYSDLVTAHRTAYRNDIITEGQCKASLASLGLPKMRAEAIVYLEWVRKYPRVTKAEKKEIEDAWSEIQSDYSRAYIESFRRGLITETELVAYLTAIGIEPKVAQVTAFFEGIKLLPKAKPVPIPTPLIPLPPTPPTYED